MKKILISILITQIFTFNLLAEDAERGRLADGRAYRTDDQGYQLVDYIAELEMRVEELQSQLIAAQNEKSYPSQSNNFAEKDLITNQQIREIEEIDSHQALANEEMECPPQVVCPPQTECPPVAMQDCSSCESETNECYAKLTNQKQTNDSLNHDIALLRSNLELYKSQADQARSENEKLLAYEQRLSELNREIESKNDQNSVTLREVSSLELKIASQEALITKQEQDLRNLNVKLTSQDQTIAQLRGETTRLQGEKDRYAMNLEESRAALNQKKIDAQKAAQTQKAVAIKETPKRESAFTHLKDKLKADVIELEKLVNQRAALERKYKSSQKRQAVSIKLNKLKTTDGYTVPMMRSEIEKAQKFYTLSRLQKNIIALRKGVKQDISLLERLTK